MSTQRTTITFTHDQLYALIEGASYATAVAAYQDPETIGLTEVEYTDFQAALAKIGRAETRLSRKANPA